MWDPAAYLFDVDVWPTRQIDVYDFGPIVRYRPEHVEDEHDGLGEVRLG